MSNPTTNTPAEFRADPNGCLMQQTQAMLDVFGAMDRNANMEVGGCGPQVVQQQDSSLGRA